MNKRLLLAGAIATGLIAAPAIALASVPDSSGVIHGCYDNKGGSLSVIDPSTDACSNKQTALDWNQAGPQGPVGPTGPQGPAGPGVDHVPGVKTFTAVSSSYGHPFDQDYVLSCPAGETFDQVFIRAVSVTADPSAVFADTAPNYNGASGATNQPISPAALIFSGDVPVGIHMLAVANVQGAAPPWTGDLTVNYTLACLS